MGIDALADMQDKLYAQDQWGVLLVFQAMDAAGKDGAIKHVMSGVNPQGCQVYSFKAPSSEDLDHDYLWRTTRCLPERGRIGIFNRSYYEEVLVVRVHPKILEGQKVPRSLLTKKIWDERFEDIAAFERYIARNGYAVAKFFLNVSKDEQQRRFLERLDQSGQELEVLAQRREGAELLGRLHEGLRGRDPQHRDRARALVHRPGRPQVVRPPRRGRAPSTTRCGDLDLAYPKVDEAKRQELAAARDVAGRRRRSLAARLEEGQARGEEGQGQEVEEGQEVPRGPRNK